MCLVCGSVLKNGHPIVFPRDGLPEFPCGYPEPYLLPTLDIALPIAEAFALVMSPDEARGHARRLLELADEADARTVVG